MNSGAGRPGTPMMGQRSIFGTGRGPVFAQVPAYTPVTRAPDPREQPQPPQANYGAYARQGGEAEPHGNPPGVSGFSSPNGAPQPYPNANRDRGVTQDYSTPSYPAPNRPAPSYSSQPQTQANPAYPAQAYPAQPQSQPNQHYAPQSYAAPVQANPAQPTPHRGQPAQGYQPQPSQPQINPAQGNPARPYPEANFPERIFPEATTHGDSSGDHDFANGNFADASFPDASFGEETHNDTGQSANAPYGEHYGEQQPLDLDAPADSYGAEQNYAPHPDQAVHEYVSQASHDGASAGYGHGIPAHQALQAFDAPYEQPPQIPLGSTTHARQSTHGFYDGEQVDADFLDESQFAPGADGAAALPARKAGLRSRSVFMVGSALLGAIALGGALAFAYKQSGGAMSGGQPPLVQADNRPVKEPPQQAGGKDFPHKNKLIYERLQNGDQPEAEHVVPRQEELAMPTMPGANPTAGLPAEAAAAPAAPAAVATVDDPSAADGGPRRVKTLVVRPDGSVQTPPAPPAAEAQPPAAPQQVAAAEVAPPPQMAMAEPALPPPPQAAPAPMAAPAPVAAAPVAADPQPVAAIPAAKPKPKVVAAAAADAAPQAAAPSQYVVQVGSKQNQTEALATFADMQQKYPTLLASYRPMVQKADLGTKGVWYRLRIGPIVDKTAAAKLCSQLKSQGHPDCLVMAAQ